MFGLDQGVLSLRQILEDDRVLNCGYRMLPKVGQFANIIPFKCRSRAVVFQIGGGDTGPSQRMDRAIRPIENGCRRAVRGTPDGAAAT